MKIIFLLLIPFFAFSQQCLERSFLVCYDSAKKTTILTRYTLSPEMLNSGKSKRQYFRQDPNIGGEHKTDYLAHSGMDRGHLVPARDVQGDSIALLESYYTTNQAPQNRRLNRGKCRGKWKKLEIKIRTFVANKGTVTIYTGPYFEKVDSFYKSTPIPTHFFKIIVWRGKAIGFLIPNEKMKNQLSIYAVDPNFFEKITKVKFVHSIDLLSVFLE